jgi:hypothetical protein
MQAVTEPRGLLLCACGCKMRFLCPHTDSKVSAHLTFTAEAIVQATNTI